MSECAGLSGEQIAWMTVSREIEDILVRGFTGDIVLHCQFGAVKTYNVSVLKKPGLEDRTIMPGEERRTAGPRNGEDRRQKG